MPDSALMRAYPISEYQTATVAGAAIILMIMNNLDRKVAQFPEELVTYGGNGQVSELYGIMSILSGDIAVNFYTIPTDLILISVP